MESSSPPSHTGHCIRKAKRTEDVGGNEIENGAFGGGTQGPGSIGPLLLSNNGGIASGSGFLNLLNSLIGLGREDQRQKGLLVGRLGLGLFLLASPLGVVVVFFKGHGGVMLLAHVRHDTANNGLIDQAIFLFTFLFVETRIASVESEVSRSGHGKVGG